MKIAGMHGIAGLVPGTLFTTRDGWLLIITVDRSRCTAMFIRDDLDGDLIIRHAEHVGPGWKKRMDP